MLKSVLQKTIGGLDKAYYFRHFFFGLVITGILLAPMFLNEKAKTDIALIVVCTICLFLYPFSRFVYESIMDFIFGSNFFLVDGIFFLLMKLITMSLCFVFAPFISVIGFIYLYYYHTKNKTFDEIEDMPQE